ncbi:hypothetical protein DPM19_31480 [Actinomadura craniellae]|uniref:Uncharacterized protein n=1 Tax=Actinomadura craniellae TaxID=2231787 RepID=A0A365GWS5_9ACTN|nr:hypothetical protein [Actinomadura craniellae]RAY11274.1 hypothetical protein DPM19_31480 [Actinomadura craniellae]
MLKRLAAAGAVTAAMGGVLLTASPAFAGGCGGDHGHHTHHAHHDFDYYKQDHDHTRFDNKNTNINRPVVIVKIEREEQRRGLLSGLLG